LCREAAAQVAQVYALDVSAEPADAGVLPANLEFVIFDGLDIPLPPNSIDVAHSNSVMEHLHPEDAPVQLRSLLKCLKSGGVYQCITPNRLGGPSDISKYFDDVATGLHLHEYVASELAQLFVSVGFSKASVGFFAKGRSFGVPRWFMRTFEAVAWILPVSVRKRMARLKPLKILFQTVVWGTK